MPSNSKSSLPLEALYIRMAQNAILNAGGRADKTRVHPGTQVEVIGRIEQWRDGKDSLTHPIFWLTGPAGLGKTAIVQTIAERCNAQRLPQASFFFFRTDKSRNSLLRFVATLVVQLTSRYSALGDSVATVLSDNPRILDATLEVQLTQLIAIPLQAIQQSTPSYIPLLLMIDGLDECVPTEGQQRILQAFDNVMTAYPRLCCLLVSSRNRPHIQMAFRGISSKYLHLEQRNDIDDIRRFVANSFNQIRHTHPLAHTLAPMWPSDRDVDHIIAKSSGQFIYAATVMDFIESSSANPVLSLARVLGTIQIDKKSPFSRLDAMYTHILSQVEDQQALRAILHAHLLMHNSQALAPEGFPLPAASLMELSKLYNRIHTQAMVDSCLSDLTPILQYGTNDHDLLLYHASFPDFLQDKSRSGKYFVDLVTSSREILPVIFGDGFDDRNWIKFGHYIMTQMLEFPPGFMNTLTSSKKFRAFLGPSVDSTILVTIYDLCSRDDIENFKCIIRHWIEDCNLDDIIYDNIKDIPFSGRYFQMARANRDYALDSEMATALCPVTDFDRRESALWLNDLLHHIHREVYPHDAKRYTQLLEQWILWAISNHISCDGLGDLTGAQQHMQSTINEDSETNVEPVSTSKRGIRRWLRTHLS